MWSQDTNSFPLPPSRSQSNLPELPSPPAIWDTNLVAFLVGIWEWNAHKIREMGGNLLKNVCIDVAGKRSFFDMEAFGRSILVLVKLWGNCSSSGWNFWSVGRRDLSILHMFTGNTQLVGLFWCLLWTRQIWTKVSDSLGILKDEVPYLWLWRKPFSWPWGSFPIKLLSKPIERDCQIQ